MIAIRQTGKKWCSIVSGLVLAAMLLTPGSALSATQENANPPTGNEDASKKKKPKIVDDREPGIPPPEKIEILPPTGKDNSEGVEPAEKVEEDAPSTGESANKPIDEPPPPIQRDVSRLPIPVARMRELIMEAARSGKVEDLRRLIGSGQNITTLSLGGIDGDPIEFFKSLSGDDQGHEILAILLEVLEAGYVHMDKGTENELYVWPYFFAWPLDKLSPEQKVELFRIVTAGDYEDMQSFGGYIFYRVGITPEGRWQFFVAGD